MTTSGTWRRQLLGSLQGQLQLATYLVVFLGFTSASSAGLWIGQRNLIENEVRILRSSAEAMQACLSAGGNNDYFVQQELLVHSSGRTKLWMEKRNGELVLPESDHLPISRAAVEATMAANPKRVVGLQRVLDLEERQLLTELVQRLPDGSHLWIHHEVSSNQQALSRYLALMMLIWGSCLALTLLMVSWLVRRIVQPLNQLNAATAEVTADSLARTQLQLQQAPLEVLQLSNTYNALLERLAESWSQQRQFVSAVSHELRTPLTVMKGSSSLLARSASTDFQTRQVHRIQDATQQMSTMVDALLGLVRYERNTDDSPVRSISEEELTQIIAQSQAQADEKALSFDVQIDGNPKTRATNAVLTIILGNLIRNGIAATPYGAIHIGMNEDTIWVRDEGEGFSSIPHSEGHGLGLMIVDDLCHRYGWQFDIGTHPDGGCEAVINLALEHQT